MPKFVGNPTGTIDKLESPWQDDLLAAINLKTPGGRWAYHSFIMRTGRRGGKTFTGALATALKVRGLPNEWSWACAPTFPKLQDYVFPALQRTIPTRWIADWEAQNWTLKLKNGHTLQFRSLDDVERGRGPGLAWLWVDEGRDVSLEAWKTLKPAVIDRKGQSLVTTTPNGRDWCDRELFQPAVEGRPGYWAVKYRTIDNPMFARDPALRAAIEEERASNDPLWFAQEYEAEVVSFAGAVFGSTLEAQIIRDREEEGAAWLRRLIPEWPRIDADRYCACAIDPGTDHPFASTFGVKTDDGGLALVGEYLERERPLPEHVRGLRAMLDWHDPGNPPQPNLWPIDKSQAQAAYDLASLGIFANAAPNSVVDGIRRVQSWLAVGKLYFVESRVPHTIEQMRNYRWAEHHVDGELKRERVIKRDDDLPDTVRYLCMAWPDMPTRSEPRAPRAGGEVPAESQWAVERMRRCEAIRRGDDVGEIEDGLETVELDSPFQDFFGGGDAAW